jgi:hypothetical protein
LKKLIFLGLFCANLSISEAQTSATEKIISFYGVEWYNQQILDNQQMVDLLVAYVDRGFRIENVSPGKYSEVKPLTTINLTAKSGGSISIQQFIEEYENENFNPLLYQFFPTKDPQVFKLDGVDKIVYIESFSFLMKLNNE